jgi:hypothetical protein
MSYVETRQILSDIREIMALLNNAEFKTEKVKTSIGMTGSGHSSLRSELREINMLLLGIETWSGNDTLTGTINKVQQLNNVLIRSYQLMNAIIAIGSIGTPGGWLKLGARVVGFSISMHNLVQ